MQDRGVKVWSLCVYVCVLVEQVYLYLSDLTVSVGSTARRQLRSASTSDQVHKRGTVYRQPSIQPPSRSLPSKKEL